MALQGLRLALADGSPALAYEWSERARALVARVTPVRPPADEQQAGLLTELRVLYAADPAPRSVDGRRLDQLRDRIREQSWYGDGSGQVGEPAALEEVQAELAATDACLVAHVAVDGWITAIVVTGAQAHTVRLCEATPVGEDLDRIAAVRADLDRVPGVAVCGAAYDGLGIPACIASAQRAAAKVVADLDTLPETMAP